VYTITGGLHPKLITPGFNPGIGEQRKHSGVAGLLFEMLAFFTPQLYGVL